MGETATLLSAADDDPLVQLPEVSGVLRFGTTALTALLLRSFAGCLPK
jgi:hypothetical protein